MATAPDNNRIDAASRIIKASPETIYGAFLDPEAVATWRPPAGMRAEIYSFNPEVGGSYRMAFVYEDATPGNKGKSLDNADVFEGRFLELVPNYRIVEAIKFESDDPDFAEEMIITTTLVPLDGGTEVTIEAGNVPSGISPEDHQLGMNSSLENLAHYIE